MTEREKMLKSAVDEGDEPEVYGNRGAPANVIELYFNPEHVVYIMTADLICMTKNGAEAYVVARAIADACKRCPVDPEHDADEVRFVADRVSRLIHVRAIRGEVGEKDTQRLAGRGEALLNTMGLVCSRHVDMCFVADTIVNLLERGLNGGPSKSARYEKIIGAVTRELDGFLDDYTRKRAEIMRERDQMDRGRTAMREQDLWRQEGPNSQDNIMYR